ncbi:MAG: uroporphyrinogen decarboxylase [Aquificae bacterium]|nr:uroporphyrinogen decarboxylase [Aquificota bacterium]
MPRNDLFLRALRNEPVERFPVWLMRQAGRYMPEYRKLRALKPSFLDLCKDPELAARITLLPLELLGVDALILFSDILVPLEAIGVKLTFAEGEGPKLFWDGKLSSLKPFDPKETGFVYETIRRVKELQDELPVIGFAGAPFTLASYMIEGGSSREFLKTKRFMWERPKEFKRLMDLLTEVVLAYLSEQVKAGADALQIFDSWSLYLSVEDYEELVYPFVNYLTAELKERFPETPVIYFFRGSAAFLEAAADLRADALSVDWSVSLPEAMRLYDKVFQGNLEPSVLYSTHEVIKEKTLSLLKSVPRRTGFVFNLGHGLAPDMEFEKVKYLVELVKGFRPG